MSKDQLTSIILYTDYTNLSSDFSSTFRQQGLFDSLVFAKRRNQKYWWWSKNLLETVRNFGDALYTPGQHIRNDHANAVVPEDGIDFHGSWTPQGHLKGPFYSGMSMVLKIPEFQIRLLSPTSTTLHIEVALKFSGQQGIIIQMNNDKVGVNVQAMDVSWISRFAEEEERYVYFDMFVYMCLVLY